MSKLSDLLNSQPISARRAARMGAASGLHLPYGTIAAYWSGRHGRPTRETLAALATVTRIPLVRLQEAAWGTSAPLGKYVPPPEVDLLTERQRRAIDELIKSIAASGDTEVRAAAIYAQRPSDPDMDEFVREAATTELDI